jgi:hypothetical protein
MRANNFEPYTMASFLASLRDRGPDLPHSQSGKPVLYLKCWGSDYPYLQRVEQEKRWLPARIDSAPRRLIPD